MWDFISISINLWSFNTFVFSNQSVCFSANWKKRQGHPGDACQIEKKYQNQILHSDWNTDLYNDTKCAIVERCVSDYKKTLSYI